MRILYVTYAYPRRAGDVAGAFIERLATALHRRGHSVFVVAPAERGDGRAERREGVEIVRVRYAPARWETLVYRGTMVETARTPVGALTAGSLMIAQARAIARLKPLDVVHAHWWVPGGVSAWLARLARCPRYVVTLHGTDVAILESSWLVRALARRVLRAAAAVTAVSSYVAERAAQVAGIDPTKILIQPMPADVGRFSRTSAGGGGVVTVGRLVGQKRVDVVLDAVARLKKEHRREVPLTIIGDGPLRRPLEEYAERSGIAAQTRFLGEVEPEKLVEPIGDADVFAFPAVGEGLAAAEALVLGIPVVASRDGGGVIDIVPPTGAGRIVAPGDARQMAQAIDALLRDPTSKQLAAQAGKLLRERLDPDRVAGAFEAVYQRVVASTVVQDE